MNANAQSYGRLVSMTSLVLMLTLSCWVYVGQVVAAGDSGNAITLADIQKKGYEIPTDFTGAKKDHRALANFAWREFFAMVTPAGSLPANRAKPDTNKSIIDSGKSDFYQSGKQPGKLGTNLLVWETFAHRSELFPAGGNTAPATLTTNPAYHFTNTPDFNKNNALQLYNNLDEASQINQNLIFFPRTPPKPYQSKGVYNPNQDWQILFEAKVSPAEYEFGRHIKKVQTGASFTYVDLPPSPAIDGTAVTGISGNAIEIKAAWRKVKNEKGEDVIDRSRYHIAEVVYYTGEDEGPIFANNAEFALVGLHIIHKTPTYPTFIFATFEQIDALTVAGTTTDTGLYYITNYDQLTYSPMMPPQPPPAIPNPPIAYINKGDGKLHKVTLPKGNVALPRKPGIPNDPSNKIYHAGPFKVVQPPTITKDVTDVNANVQSLMKKANAGVWQYYKLKGVQLITTNEQAPGPLNPDTLDYYLANITVESSQPGVQLFKGRQGTVPAEKFNLPRSTLNLAEPPNAYNNPQFNMGGCKGCHGVAQQGGGDFSFLFITRRFQTTTRIGFSADAMGLPSPAAMAMRAKHYKMSP